MMVSLVKFVESGFAPVIKKSAPSGISVGKFLLFHLTQAEVRVHAHLAVFSAFCLFFDTLNCAFNALIYGGNVTWKTQFSWHNVIRLASIQ